jgi:hypothetical protein
LQGAGSGGLIARVQITGKALAASEKDNDTIYHEVLIDPLLPPNSVV